MRKLIRNGIILVVLLNSFIYAQAKFSEYNSMPGAFSRLGFGARGMAMGNAISAVIDGDLISYYNPALSIFQKGNALTTSLSVLSLDRRLNFIGFTKRFSEAAYRSDGKFVPSAGISAGFISSGVSNIDERDDEGVKVGDLSTSENQFFLSVANQFSRKLAVGIAFKFYYYKLLDNLTTSSLGIDIGMIYILNDDCTISLGVTDLLSKYKWDSSTLYSTSGEVVEDKFPILKKIGIAYKFFNSKLITAVEFESSNGSTNMLRLGAEFNLIENLYLRAGLDRWVLNNRDIPVRPSFGFGYNYQLSSFVAGINYAYTVEPYSPWNAHVIGININF